MRPPLVVPLLALLAACAQSRAPLTPIAAASTRAAPPPSAAPALRFVSPPEAPPAFLDRDRKAKILASSPQLDAHFAAYAERDHVPGLAVGLVVDGDLVWSKGYGVRDLAARAPVDEGTLFRVSSMTKAFTAAAVLELRDAGKLSLDAPAEEVLPELRGVVYPTRDAPRITLRDLMTHNGGLPHDAPAHVDPGRGPTEGETLKSLAGLELQAPPGSEFSYSNLGFALAGAAVSRASGVTFAEFLTAHLLSPLGMASTSFEPAPERLALGHVVRAGGVERATPLRLGADPAGGLYSSAKDLARWASFQLDAWPPRDGAERGPLKRSSVREAQRLATWRELWVPARVAGKEPSARAIGYGFGWIVEETCDWDIAVWHNGSLEDGYRSIILLLPDRGVALVALQNLYEPRYDLDASVREGMRLLDAAGALPKREWTPTPRLLGVRDAVLALRDRWDDAVAARVFSESSTSELPVLRADFAKDLQDHGACRVTRTTADGRARLKWEMACDKGGQSFRITLDGQARVEDIHRKDGLPPEPREPASRRKCPS